jgi:hypothetical protein
MSIRHDAGSFDCDAVRFATGIFAQDDKNLAAHVTDRQLAPLQ